MPDPGYTFWDRGTFADDVEAIRAAYLAALSAFGWPDVAVPQFMGWHDAFSCEPRLTLRYPCGGEMTERPPEQMTPRTLQGFGTDLARAALRAFRWHRDEFGVVYA